MAEIKVVTSALDNLSGEFNDIASELRHICSEVSGAKLGAGFDISSKNQINNTLERISESVGRSARTVSQMSDKLRTVSQAYKNTENKLCGNHINGSGYSHGGISSIPFYLTNPIIATLYGTAKLLGDKYTADFVKGEISGETSFLGLTTAGALSGSLFHVEAELENNISWKFKDDKGNWDFKSFGIGLKGKVGGSVATGEVKGDIGALHGKLSGDFITGTVTGEAKFGLFDDGEFNPSIYVGAKAEGSVLSGEGELKLGDDNFGVDVNASGDLLHAEAEAKVGVGYIGEDEDGNAQYGLSAKASAMASAAEGEVEGGFTLFGIDIDVGVKGYAGAAGVEAGGSVTTDGVTASFSGAALLGAGLDVNIDWSGFDDWVDDSQSAIYEVGEFLFSGFR